MDSEDIGISQNITAPTIITPPVTSKDINVYPNIKINKTICKARIRILELILFESVSLVVNLMDENETIIENRVYKIDKSNGYDNWTNDDKFIIDWVKAELQK